MKRSRYIAKIGKIDLLHHLFDLKFDKREILLPTYNKLEKGINEVINLLANLDDKQENILWWQFWKNKDLFITSPNP